MVALGIFLIAIGGLASGAFYLPLKYVKKWSWETGWMIYSVFALLLGPWILAMITIPQLFDIVSTASASNIIWPIIFGLGWGIGGLTWGLSIRYLGIGLGNALPLGLTAAISTVVGPLVPLFLGQDTSMTVGGKLAQMFAGTPGMLVLLSIIISLAGIAVCGWAASLKDKEQKTEDREGANKEFNLQKGLLVALVAGVMSACFAFGEYAGTEMTAATAKLNPGTIWSYNPVYAVLLIGGFAFNFTYTVILSFRNKAFADYKKTEISVGRNFSFAALAGIMWFAQFVFKGIGTTKIPENLSFITWSLLFTFVIVFSNIIGLLTKEWKGASKKTMAVLMSGLALLIISVFVVGIASYLKQ